MSRPIQATISATALRHNYAVAKAAAPRSMVLAVVKANAYGHGVERVANAIPDADGFAILEIDGALMLRERFPAKPVVLLEGFFDAEDLRLASAADLGCAIHHEGQLALLEAEKPNRPIDAFLKINTGMNRLGFLPANAKPALERLRRSGTTRSITLMTHFASSEVPGGIEDAVRRFDEATKGVDLPRTLANTGAIFSQPRAHADMVRLGIGLYGATPFGDRPAATLGLKPVMTLASRLIAVQELQPGDAVGYGGHFQAERPMRIGVVACGYADGYPRHAPSGTPILVAGGRSGTVGRVSMDMITVDLTPVPHAAVGSPVVLWGEGMPVDEVAIAAGTVGYELLCGVTARVPMVDA
jgi:alanine racemase